MGEACCGSNSASEFGAAFSRSPVPVPQLHRPVVRSRCLPASDDRQSPRYLVVLGRAWCRNPGRVLRCERAPGGLPLGIELDSAQTVVEQSKQVDARRHGWSVLGGTVRSVSAGSGSVGQVLDRDHRARSVSSAVPSASLHPDTATTMRSWTLSQLAASQLAASLRFSLLRP